jgi:hypothetical protein
VLAHAAVNDPRAVSAEELQRVLAAAVRLYAARDEAGEPIEPFPARQALDPDEPLPSATDVCLATTAMLDAVTVEVFELAMWKTWSATPGGDAQELEG